MERHGARGAALLTTFAVVGALIVSVATVAGMATRSISGAEGVRIFEVASVALVLVLTGARALGRRALRQQTPVESATRAT